MYSGRRDVALEEARHSRRVSPVGRWTTTCHEEHFGVIALLMAITSFDPGTQTSIYSGWPCSAMQVRYT